MKDIFSIVTFTAAAISFALFLTTVQFDDGMLEPRWPPTATVAVNGCDLRAPLLADRTGGLSVLAQLHSV
ncbi:hypothetical protein H8A99_13790 [Bradyrhizobium sp. Arg68]|uniref:hypothetical protein n=1 Tax=Bradyrhizobium ivorense TaxID=2511166 RepID=UPI001E5B6C9D|nr:hypothetical protein [Bradyrhizobium ivorense]MCC8937516.1 hypothetical protein [Bradyrhizobium ivorense]